MNKISFQFTKEDGLTDSWTGGFELIINGRETDNFLDEAGFLLSTERDGLFPVFAGSCGQMGCCGIYIEVKHQDDKIIWEKFWHGGCSGEPEPEDAISEIQFVEDFVIKSPIVFDREEYQAMGAKLQAELKEMPTRYEYFLKEYERYKSGDLMN